MVEKKRRRVRGVWCVGELVKQVRVVIATRYHSGVDKAMYWVYYHKYGVPFEVVPPHHLNGIMHPRE